MLKAATCLHVSPIQCKHDALLTSFGFPAAPAVVHCQLRYTCQASYVSSGQSWYTAAVVAAHIFTISISPTIQLIQEAPYYRRPCVPAKHTHVGAVCKVSANTHHGHCRQSLHCSQHSPYMHDQKQRRQVASSISAGRMSHKLAFKAALKHSRKFIHSTARLATWLAGVAGSA